MATVTRQGEAGHFYHVTNYNFPSDWIEFTKTVPLKPGRGTVVGRALLQRKAVQIADVLADPEYTHAEYQKKAGYRTFLSRRGWARSITIMSKGPMRQRPIHRSSRGS